MSAVLRNTAGSSVELSKVRGRVRGHQGLRQPMIRNRKGDIDPLPTFVCFLRLPCSCFQDVHLWFAGWSVLCGYYGVYRRLLRMTPAELNLGLCQSFRPNIWDVAISTLWFSTLGCFSAVFLLCTHAKQ